MTTINYYDGTGTIIMRVRTYATAALAWRALQRAAARGQIAMYAGKRTASDAPTCHH